MRYVKAIAPAKVNLALRVGAARSDGFHPLDTVFEALDLYEEFEAWDDPSGDIALTFAPGLGSSLPVDASNLAIRAARELRRECGVSHGAKMRIAKHIPIAGGMAGGSADAAATLVGLNELWQVGLDAQELATIGARLGSDVPFALMGGVAHGTGRGEYLSAVPTNARHGFVMLTNPRGLSTPAVFRHFDAMMLPSAEPLSHGAPTSTQELRDVLTDAAATISADEKRGSADTCAGVSASGCADAHTGARLSGNADGNAAHHFGNDAGSLERLGSLMVNDLEAPAFALRPDLERIIEQLRAMAHDSRGSKDECGNKGREGERRSKGSADKRRGQGEREGTWSTHAAASQKTAATPNGSTSAPIFGVILSGSGPTLAVLCAPADATALAAELDCRFPELMAIAAHGPAEGARVVEVRDEYPMRAHAHEWHV